MLKLTRHLFEWGPSAELMDFYERGLYNHILASQDPATGGVTYYCPLKPGAWKSYSTGDRSFWCCVGTGLENHAKYADTIYFHGDDTLFVNLFIPSELTGRIAAWSSARRRAFPTRAGRAWRSPRTVRCGSRCACATRRGRRRDSRSDQRRARSRSSPRPGRTSPSCASGRRRYRRGRTAHVAAAGAAAGHSRHGRDLLRADPAGRRSRRRRARRGEALRAKRAAALQGARSGGAGAGRGRSSSAAGGDRAGGRAAR